MAEELAADLDAMAGKLKPGGTDAALATTFQKLRARAHQMHAATRAADHFLDQDNNVDRSTGSWLIECALGLADKTANELKGLANGMRRAPGDATPAPTDAAGSRRPGQATTLRAATV